MRILQLIKKSVDTRITPLAYLLAVWQLNFGVNQMFADERGGGTTILSQVEALIPSEYWGLLLSMACVVLIIGMFYKIIGLIQLSSFIAFCLYIMAAISYAMAGFWWLHVPSALLTAIMFGYYFLAAGLDQLWDYIPNHGTLDR